MAQIKKRDITLYRGDNQPNITWAMPFDVTGYVFTLIVRWDWGSFSETTTQGGLTVDETNNSVSWSTSTTDTSEIPLGTYAAYELRAAILDNVQTRYYGAVSGLGGLSIDPYAAAASSGGGGGGGTILPLSADQISYIYPATGTVTRTGTAKFSDFLSVADFGAVGDGSTDDTAAIQACYNAASQKNAIVWFPTKGPYKITSTITVQAVFTLTAAGTGSDIHFADTYTAHTAGCHTKIIAGAAMSSMFTVVFNSGLSQIGPFYSVFEDMIFDGNSLATVGIYSNYTMHLNVERCAFFGMATCLQFMGYGVARIHSNVFRGTSTCIALGDATGALFGGGDSNISNNDFYVTSIGVDVGLFGGNTEILGNTFTREGSGTTYGVRLSGDYSSDASKEVRHVRILSNELCGMTYGIYARKSAAGRNNYHHSIAFNHVTQFSTFSTGRLIDANGVDNLSIFENDCNLIGSTEGSDFAIYLVNCQYCLIQSNRIVNYTNDAIRLQDAIHIDVVNNYLRNIGKGSAGNVCINLINTTTFCQISYNRIIQDSAGYAQNGIYEQDTLPASNRANNNIFVGVTTRQRFNATGGSDFREITAAAAKPTTGAYRVGDFVNNLTPALANGSTILGWARLTTGTAHTLGTDWAAMYSQSAVLQGTAVYDPPSLADGVGATTTVTVTGAALGQFSAVSFSLDLQGISVTSYVSAANTVSVRFQNESGGLLDLASGTLTAKVFV